MPPQDQGPCPTPSQLGRGRGGGAALSLRASGQGRVCVRAGQGDVCITMFDGVEGRMGLIHVVKRHRVPSDRSSRGRRRRRRRRRRIHSSGITTREHRTTPSIKEGRLARLSALFPSHHHQQQQHPLISSIISSSLLKAVPTHYNQLSLLLTSIYYLSKQTGFSLQ